ncbi:Protein N-terminal glutamine amidohydrolase [Collichthys lucidus]|uniref:Protein N-terminal glutamine amidohydrolase n=1 Tax=Collichthys lucidus TaxID=240159 RepID=A0A4U5VLC7_COLLU|nr:Protein N-terminal glutamine amidohydrolase [Collichthys lucidus]
MRAGHDSEHFLPTEAFNLKGSLGTEENVWKLCDSVRTERTAPLEQLYVIFISNEKRTVPLWKQRSGRGDQPVIWVCDVMCLLTDDVMNDVMAFQDYHVILMQAGLQSDSLVYDLDSELPFPVSLQLYAAQALRSDRNIRPEYHRKLRVVPADSFLLNFASDRSHMMNPDGSWKMPPPLYPPIHTAACRMNLDDFISVNPAVGWGRVFSLEHFLQRYTGSSSPPSAASS